MCTILALSRRLLWFCAIAFANLAQADWLTIAPVVIEIATPRKPVAVKVTNDSDRPVTFQLDAAIWQQVDGNDVYSPSDDLLLSPSILNIPPHKNQTFRVMLRDGKPSPIERTYRVMVEDISEATIHTDAAEVAFKFTHNLPVLVAPSGKIANAMQWRPCPQNTRGGNSQHLPPEASPSATKLPNADMAKPENPAATDACVRLLNAGNRRVKVQKLILSGDGWQESLSLKPGYNVLVGAEREWHVALPKAQQNLIRQVHVHTAEGGVLTAESDGR